MKNVSKLIHEAPHPTLSGKVTYDSIDFLRSLVSAFNGRHEYLNTDKSIEELVNEYTAYLNDECDIDGEPVDVVATDLKPSSKQPLHTRKEIIVGLGFDIINGRKDSLRIDQFLKMKEGDVFSGEGVRSYVAHVYDVRRTIDEVFDLIQRTDEALDIALFPYSNALGVSVRRTPKG